MDFIEATPSRLAPPKQGQSEMQEEEEEEEEDQVDKEKTLDAVKKLLAKVVTSTTMSDGNMRYLIQQKTIISRFISWTSVQGIGVDLEDEIRMSGALCLGNIGRSGMILSHTLSL
jgi:hypothetical protein